MRGNSPGDILKFALDNGWDGRVRIRHQRDGRIRGIVTEYTTMEFKLWNSSSNVPPTVYEFADVAGVELLIDPEENPLPSDFQRQQFGHG